MSEAMSNTVLALVARGLSARYGVKVVAKGNEAYTIQKSGSSSATIYIPAIGIDDENYRTLIRGYIDHEAGHVRFTSPDAVSSFSMASDAGKTIWNMYEDVYVERMMSEVFPGCRHNLCKLAKLVFLPPANADDVNFTVATLQYILYAVRSHAVPDLAEAAASYRSRVGAGWPDLPDKLDEIIKRVPVEGTSTAANVALANETLRIIEEYTKNNTKSTTGDNKSTTGDNNKSTTGDNNKSTTGDNKSTTGGSTDDNIFDRTAQPVVNLAELVRNALSLGNASHNITPAIQQINRNIVWEPSGCDVKVPLGYLSSEDSTRALRTSVLLHAQLSGLLQTVGLNRGGVGRTGLIDTRLLSRLSVGDARIYRRRVEKLTLNTEVVLVVDMSGSMQNANRAALASQAVYAMMYSLRRLPGVTSSAYGFSGHTVGIPIVPVGHKLTTKVFIRPNGSTLCGQALAHAVSVFQSENSRKIIFLITDGETKDKAYFMAVSKGLQEAGIEVLGLCIACQALQPYLKAEAYAEVYDLRRDLVPAVFRLLRRSLVGVS